MPEKLPFPHLPANHARNLYFVDPNRKPTITEQAAARTTLMMASSIRNLQLRAQMTDRANDILSKK